MSHFVICRVCKQKFDTESISAENWVMPTKNYYYHLNCYTDWKNNRSNAGATRDENFWFESLIDYLYQELKMPVNFAKLNSQWNNFIKPTKGYTPKGIYLSIRYYYDVLHGDINKAQGGIGIVPNIYLDAREYWTNLEIKKKGTIEAIIEQIKQRNNRPVNKIIQIKNIPAQKTRWNLDDI